MKVFKFAVSWMLLSVSVLLTGCSGASPDAGQEAVLVDKPWFFGHGGVRTEAISTGLTWVWLTTDVEYVNMYPEQHDMGFEDIMSSDGIPLDFNASLRIRVTDSVVMIKNFGPEWYKNTIAREFEKYVRKEVKAHTMREAAIDGNKSEEMDDNVTKNLTDYIANAKIPVELISVTLGRANPPDPVKNQRIETAQQEQRQITEEKRRLAEINRKAAEEARADADNAYRNMMGMSPSQFVELERIKMMNTVCENKGAGCTFIIGGEVSPVVNVR